MTEINNSLQKLAEEKYPLKLTKDLTPNELEEVMSENFIQLKRREGFIAGYKAALSSTERVECYLPCEEKTGFVLYGYGDEDGESLVRVKKVTLTVVPNHQS